MFLDIISLKIIFNVTLFTSECDKIRIMYDPITAYDPNKK